MYIYVMGLAHNIIYMRSSQLHLTAKTISLNLQLSLGITSKVPIVISVEMNLYCENCLKLLNVVHCCIILLFWTYLLNVLLYNLRASNCTFMSSTSLECCVYWC